METPKPPNAKITSARAFIRSLNILLKYARLYSFDHARTIEQFNTAWNELHEAIPPTNEAGLLLGATGSQLLLDGMPLEANPTERSFAQLLSAAGLASIQFTSRVTKEDFERLVRAFPTSNTKPSVLADQLKAALAGTPNIKINEIRFVAEDASREALAAGLLTAQSLGADADSMKEWLKNPQKLVQLIAAAEGSRGEGEPGNGSEEASASGAGSPAEADSAPTAISPVGSASGGSQTRTGGGPGTGDTGTGRSAETGAPSGTTGSGAGASGSSGKSTYSGIVPTGSILRGAEASVQSASPASTGGSGRVRRGGPGPGGLGTGSGVGSSSVSGASRGAPGGAPVFSSWTSKDDDILGILKLLTSLGQNFAGTGGSLQSGPFQEELTKLPAESQEMLRSALAAIAAQTPTVDSKDPMLLRLAEHLAIKFALERYQRGEVKVNAVRQMFEKMSQEIEGLRKILGAHEQKLADAGVIVESTAELLDRQFWAAVPERGKYSVLTSSEAWCIPARNLKQYVEELIQRGDEKSALKILDNYVRCLQSDDVEARRRTAIGLADLAEVYASLDARPLAPAIQIAGAQLGLERDDNLQGLISAAFVRLAQEAGLRRFFPPLLQALDSLDAIENQRPVFGQTMRPRIGLEKRVPEYLEDILRGDRKMDGVEKLLQRIPRTTSENLILRFNRTSSRADMQKLVELSYSVGEELMASLRDSLRSGAANEAAETGALLSRLDPGVVSRWLPERIAEWPRQAQDRVVRLLAMGGAPERGNLILGLLHMLDPVLLALAIDEIGLSEDRTCIAAMLHIAEGDIGRGSGPFVQLKAVEALGRLKAEETADLLRGIAGTRRVFHWSHPAELRLAAMQSLAKIDPGWTQEFASHSGFTESELGLAPLDPLPNAKYFRRRRYPRVRLSQAIPAIITVGQDSYRLEVRGLSLSGGVALGEKHLPPGTLVSMRLGSSLRPIRAQVLMRDARAQGLGFEIADMDLDERARLRKLLLGNDPSAFYQEEPALAESAQQHQ